MLQSFYEVARPRVAELMRAAIALPSIGVVDALMPIGGDDDQMRPATAMAEAVLAAGRRSAGSSQRGSEADR